MRGHEQAEFMSEETRVYSGMQPRERRATAWYNIFAQLP
jgi:hypothetical protein